MTIESIEGMILQAVRLSDSRWRLSLITREQGRLTAWYRAGARAKAHNCLAPFMPLSLALTLKRQWYQVKAIERNKGILYPLKDEALLSGWYLNELLMYLLLEGEANLPLYNAYTTTLQTLSQGVDRLALEISLRQFEWQLLNALGYGISLTKEAASGEPIQVHKTYQCMPKAGLILTEKGIPGEVFIALSKGEWHDPSVLKGAKAMMRRLIDDLLDGRPLKTRELFRQMHSI